MYTPFITTLHYKNFPQWFVPIILFISLFLTYETIWTLWQTPIPATIILFFISIALLLFFRSIKMCIIFIGVSLFGTLHDIYFIAHDLWHYKETTIGTIPLYLPLTWGIISIIIIATFKTILILLKERYHNPPSFTTALTSTLATLGIALLGMAHLSMHQPVLIALFILIDVLYTLIMRSVPLMIIGIIALSGGTLGEITSVAIGAWHYPSGTIAGIPPFIFIGWDIIGIIIAGTYITLDAQDAPWRHIISGKSSSTRANHQH